MPYRRELLVHCYRLLGSLEDAEDALQETWLRAWRRLATFEPRSTIRAWLYKIATNAALDALDSRHRRLLPTATHAPADMDDPLPGLSTDLRWLEPFPDALLPVTTATPETVYDQRESVALAFLAAIQYLPGRQRAVLILRDVLDLSAQEVADLLDTTVAGVTSALQRARVTMRTHHAELRSGTVDPRDDAATARLRDTGTTRLLDAYMRAWEAADAHRLVALLRDDAVLTMPPLTAWYSGAAAIGAFLTTQLFAGDARGRFRMLQTRANECPAFAAYTADTTGLYRSSALHVLEIQDGRIAALHAFVDAGGRLFTRFGLPPTAGKQTNIDYGSVAGRP
jgi:RNA polymerase sigma-70 factor (ECF subfamily)